MQPLLRWVHKLGVLLEEARLLVPPPQHARQIFLGAPIFFSTRPEKVGAPRSKIAACTFLARRIELAATKTLKRTAGDNLYLFYRTRRERT